MPKLASASVTDRDLDRLLEIECEILYDEPPSATGSPFEIRDGDGCVMLSAPHGARSYRNNQKEIWHEEDEYTAGFALLLSEIVGVPAIALTRRSDGYDPNHTVDCEYKSVMRERIEAQGIQFVIDLHGAALHSNALDKGQTIDLGLTSDSETHYSLKRAYVELLTHLIECRAEPELRRHFVVGRNKFMAEGRGTITRFTSGLAIPGTQQSVQAVQIEMKPQVRILERFSRASLFSSCGAYAASRQSVRHMLQSLVDFIVHLNEINGQVSSG